jgi:hypothetical protein
MEHTRACVNERMQSVLIDRVHHLTIILEDSQRRVLECQNVSLSFLYIVIDLQK